MKTFWGYTINPKKDVEFTLEEVEGLTSDPILEAKTFFANLKGFRQVFITEAIYNRIKKAKEASYASEQTPS